MGARSLSPLIRPTQPIRRIMPTMFAPTPRRIDLHTHSLHSDGTLDPTALVQIAAAGNVELLALTDHDTTAGIAECARACAVLHITHLTGVEITASWRGQEIHVVGLGFDPDNAALRAHLTSIVQQRRERVAAILDRLRRKPHAELGDTFGVTLTTLNVPTRAHIARELVACGAATSIPQAFAQWLARGRPGHVPQEWPALSSAIEVIRIAGGQAVLAHPQQYKLSSGGRRALVAQFAQDGGAALELNLPSLSDSDAAQLGELARAHNLAGSAGSDFHEPGLPWRPIGRFAKLPVGVEPLWMRLLHTPAS
jgi:predicted metal-dependent phosphoesterase TrpH